MNDMDVFTQIMNEGIKSMRIINKSTGETLFDNCMARKEDYFIVVEVSYRKINKKYLKKNFWDIVLMEGDREHKLFSTSPSYYGLNYIFNY